MAGVNPKEPGSKLSGKSLLIDWANEQDGWIRKIVQEIIDSKSPLSESQLADVYNRLTQEKELSDLAGESIVYPKIESKETTTVEEQVLRLTRISDVKNVNALAPSQELVFNDRLTVIYGENAVGKSGYARILKGVAAVRTAEDILSDIQKPPAPPEANLAFKLESNGNTNAKEVVWKGEVGIPPLTSIDLFDTKGVSLHVDQELSYVYVPADLSFFPLVSDAIEETRKRLDKTKKESLSTNLFGSMFNRQGSLYSKIETLGASTDTFELQKLADVSKEEEELLEELETRVDALRSDQTQASLQLAETEHQWLTSLRTMLQAASTLNIDLYNLELGKLKQAREDYSKSTDEAFSEEEIPGRTNNTWKEFISSADKYISDALPASYPAKSDVCIYCHQSLSEASLKLLNKYREFCNNEHAQSVKNAEMNIQKATESIMASQSDRFLQECTQRIERAQEETVSFHRNIQDVLKRITAIQKQIRQQDMVKSDLIRDLPELIDILSNKLSESEKRVDELKSSGEARKKAFNEELSKLVNLKDRITLRNHLPTILSYVDKAKWADKANSILKTFTKIGRSLTEVSKVASEQLLNQDFENLFAEECQLLNAPSVSLDFSGRKGQSARKKFLVSGHKLSEILSEGEQKVIALADFVAESRLRKRGTPIIFDDPVNSLDYKRLRQVVDRLVVLSSTRQIIIFTHNIWFATELLSRFEHQKESCSYFDIYTDGNLKGLISGGTSPRTDSFNSLKKKINKLIESAKKEKDKETQDVFIEKAYDIMRATCEVIVESELLMGVTKRYRANVMMTKLESIKSDKLPAASAAIMPIFDKCCHIMAAHSQPLESLSVRPTLADLESDWGALQSARNQYLA